MFASFHLSRRILLASSAAFAASMFLTLPSWLPGPSAAAAPPPPALHSDPRCVFGVSKDVCKGEFSSGGAREFACTRNGVDCRTVIVEDNIFKFILRQSPGRCADPTFPEHGVCDEVKELDGTVVIRSAFTLRENLPCRYRGSWNGAFELHTDEGMVATGTAAGTLGTGSHRSPTCPTNAPCGFDCERCYGVTFIPDPSGLTGTWRVELEGTLDGIITGGTFASSEIVVTVQGFLSTPGTVNGPSDFTKWDFCGTTDGVVLAKCE